MFVIIRFMGIVNTQKTGRPKVFDELTQVRLPKGTLENIARLKEPTQNQSDYIRSAIQSAIWWSAKIKWISSQPVQDTIRPGPVPLAICIDALEAVKVLLEKMNTNDVEISLDIQSTRERWH